MSAVDPGDKKLTSQSILLSLIEMLQKFDLSDEIGRETVKNTVVYLLTQSTCDESVAKSLVNICEKLIPASNSRLQFYVDTVTSTIHPIDINTSLETCKMNRNTEIQIASAKAKLFELKEAETGWLVMDECDKLRAIQQQICLLRERLTFLIIPFLPCKVRWALRIA